MSDPAPPEATPGTLFRLRGFRILRAAIEMIERDAFDPDTVAFNLSQSLTFEPERDLVEVHTRVIVVGAHDTDAPTAFATLETQMGIEVVGLRDLPAPDGEVALPRQTLASALSVAVSTTRGVLWNRGLGSILERALLPVVNPLDLVARYEAARAEAAEEASGEAESAG